jgi:hypothetical protein
MAERPTSTPLTKDALRALALAQGLALSELDLDGLLPLVQATRAMIEELWAASLADVEPTAQFRML